MMSSSKGAEKDPNQAEKTQPPDLSSVKVRLFGTTILFCMTKNV